MQCAGDQSKPVTATSWRLGRLLRSGNDGGHSVYRAVGSTRDVLIMGSYYPRPARLRNCGTASVVPAWDRRPGQYRAAAAQSETTRVAVPVPAYPVPCTASWSASP